ncbi:hypothetical protein [Planctomicrobium piriforme]|uniref:Uncharacterized protein n=1 Tax=Planctomicrobium piriforme TaxID=1576369 RepID=A0A1I3B1H3_9PLAN|nr:hypothetical protein [Planctomicrobium piriforme]SFH56144.1 hypothetical protein SAMN05421753_101174 [Planctomicrobium piriforme]
MQLARRAFLVIGLLVLGLGSSGCDKASTTTITIRNQTGSAVTINAYITGGGKTYELNQKNLANGKAVTKKYCTRLPKGSTYPLQGTVTVGGTTKPLPAGMNVMIGETNSFVLTSPAPGAIRATVYLNATVKVVLDF